MLFPQRVYNLSFWNESCKSNSFSYERLCKRTRFQTEITTFSYSFVPFYFSPFFHLIYFRSCYILFFDSQWFSTLFSVNLRESILCTLSMIHCTQIPLPLALYFYSWFFQIYVHQILLLIARFSFSVMPSLLSNLYFLFLIIPCQSSLALLLYKY